MRPCPVWSARSGYSIWVFVVVPAHWSTGFVGGRLYGRVVRRGRAIRKGLFVWAHSPSTTTGRWHSLADHVRSTSELARSFANSFGAGDLAAALGLVHDAGKASCAWQTKLAEVSGTGEKVGINHKNLGALLVRNRAQAAAMAVLGHHGGLDRVQKLVNLIHGPDDVEALERFFGVVPEARALRDGPSLLPEAWGELMLLGEMGIRLVFSALVDADHLDTAAHAEGLSRPRVAPPTDMNELVRRFEHNRAALLADRGEPSDVDRVRVGLYEDVVRRAMREPGVYRLPAPTGSGKTMTAAGFALHHAARRGKARVIVAVPFTTITEQNAGVYRHLLGEQAVLEHHSNAELDDRRLRLAAENWDAPFVVTTTVQLFDSLFGRRPARSRKLHRLANAVVVLDEVQALPVPLLVPILDGLRLLSQHFGTTVLLASATQPSFEHLAVWKTLEITPLVDDPVELFTRLKRARYEWQLKPRPTLEQIAAQICEQRQALAIVNTVGHARTLYRLVAERKPDAEVVHLSTRMCPRHREHVLTRIRALLAEDKPVLVVSTQLVEAGVDVDFPVVFRALAPAESLQQAAGRANREGKLPGLGRVVVFDASDAPVPEFYRAGVAKTLALFGPGRDPDDPALLAEYYQRLYTGLNVDEARRGAAIQDNRAELDFRAVADGPKPTGTGAGRDRRLAFRMIDEDPVSVIVTTWDEQGRATELVRQLRIGVGPLRGVLRELRGYMVPLPRAVASAPDVRALCRPVIDGHDELWEWRGDYDPQVGVDERAIGEETVW
ncbi:CRISPR-associated helicase Cas3' [Lentzea tibetensis]|uniref:CRISPR-associated helicase Cas3 n=1 Tax=Lentzea tibetensis TaxID=2591470 RepID=A0A563EVX1_9PSEU|nr:CRISPR-associated helicase Cas3' [Lentzea tibetensis]TWP51722.1 CRISPR-associated helicase Cas3' [Lentzea tibetensis]